MARTASRRSEAKDTRWDRKACVEAKQGAVLDCPFDEENLKFPNLPRGACIDSRALYSFVTSPGPDIYWIRVEDDSQLGHLGFSFCSSSFSFFLPIFLELA